MGCGSSGHVVVPSAEETANGHVKVGNGANAHVNNDTSRKDEGDDLPTVILPETPVRQKSPIAFEIPLEDLDGTRKITSSPPPHLHRLLQPIQSDITLPDIEGKLAEAESRRQMILQQRAASAQKRAQKMMKTLHEMDRLDSDYEPMGIGDGIKRVTSNTLKLPPEPAAWEHRNI